MKLTQKEKQVKIAELQGWKLRWQNKGGGSLLDYNPKGNYWEVWIPPPYYYKANKLSLADPDFNPVPHDYFNDLNAMHEAEKIITDNQWPEYRDCLRTISLGPVRMVSEWCKADIHATAAQRAEALGQTLGLWKEGE